MADVLRAIQDQANSVMIDSSGLPFEENLKRQQNKSLKLHTVLAFPLKQNLAVLGIESSQKTRIWVEFIQTPKSVKQFVTETGVDDLAVAIGTVHGPYPSGENDIRIDILKQLNETLQMPLVLHGGSDNPDNKIREAIQNGISKEIFQQILSCLFYHGIAKTVADKPGEYEPWIMMPYADEAQKKVIAEKIRLFGSDHKVEALL